MKLNRMMADPSGPISHGEIRYGLENGLKYLHQHQYPNGEFCCYFAPDDPMQEWCVPDSTVFPTALILNALLSMNSESKMRSEIFAKAVPFFQYQIMHGGVFNYFTKWHSLFPVCPPDVDTTVFAHNFMASQGLPCPDPLPIILANRTKRGLFYTWFTLRLNRTGNKAYWRLILREFKQPIRSIVFWIKNESGRNDIDGVVSANILFFLGKRITTGPMITYLLDIIKNIEEEACDKWYRNPFTFYYFLSKCFDQYSSELHPGRELIINRIVSPSLLSGQFGHSILDTALGLSALLNLGYNDAKIPKAARYLLSSQLTTGEWPKHCLYYSGPSKAVGWGSEELTTGFCIEALSKYQKSIQLCDEC